MQPTKRNLAAFYRKSRRRHLLGSGGEFEASSIADLAFLLLIFFIVTSSFILRQGVFLSLPAKKSSSIQVDAKQIVQLTPEASGFAVDGERMSREKTAELLTRKNREISELIVVIYMRPTVAYDRLVDALSVAKESGVRRLSLKDGEDL